MDISVIVPTYKPDEYIWNCLDSIYNQTYNHKYFEVIIILNGCNYPYLNKIKDYIFKHPKVFMNIIQTDEPGVSNARNIGINNARGRFVTFVDDDDILSLNFLENLYEISTSTCVGCANSYRFGTNINHTKYNFISRSYIKCKNMKYSLFNYRSFLSAPWGKLIHMDIIADNRYPIDLKKSEDSLFCMRLSLNIHEIKLASIDTIYYQRERMGSTMRKKEKKLFIIKEHLFIIWKYLYEWCKYPFKYNTIFVLSRIIACCRNCINYLVR